MPYLLDFSPHVSGAMFGRSPRLAGAPRSRVWAEGTVMDAMNVFRAAREPFAPQGTVSISQGENSQGDFIENITMLHCITSKCRKMLKNFMISAHKTYHFPNTTPAFQSISVIVQWKSCHG